MKVPSRCARGRGKMREVPRFRGQRGVRGGAGRGSASRGWGRKASWWRGAGGDAGCWALRAVAFRPPPRGVRRSPGRFAPRPCVTRGDLQLRNSPEIQTLRGLSVCPGCALV